MFGGISRWITENGFLTAFDGPQQVRRTIEYGSDCVPEPKSPIGGRKRITLITLALAFVASFMGLVHIARDQVAPSGCLCVFIGISSDLAEEETTTRTRECGVARLKIITGK
jgi:hypothetical protein